MAKSARSRKQSRAKAEARRAERRRVRATVRHADDEADLFFRLMNPEVTSAEVAGIIADQYADDLNAGTIANRRLANGVPLAEVTAAAATLLAGAGDLPGAGILAWAAEAAHADGDEDTEHRHVAELLSRAEASGDPRQRAHVIRSLSGRGHPGEAAGFLEPRLRDHPEDCDAALTYSFVIREAAAKPDPGGQDRAALERFADRSGLDELIAAASQYAERTKWRDLVAQQTALTVGLLPGSHLLPDGVLGQCAVLAREAALKGTLAGVEGMTPRQLLNPVNTGFRPETTLTAFAADPRTPPALARRAAHWTAHGHYGLWQMIYPPPDPGVAITDLVSGVRRYAEFPPGMTDDAPNWSVWLGEVIPVDGIWHASGAGIMLSPVEGDALADAVDRAIRRMIKMASGMPPAELLPPEPVPYGHAAPWSARWDFESSPGAEYAQRTSGIVMMLAARLAADVEVHRARPATAQDVAVDPVPEDESWLDAPLLALHGLTPRQADVADAGYQMLLEALFRQYEYEAGLAAHAGHDYPDIDALREILTPSED